jgi:hypothetical protein
MTVWYAGWNEINKYTKKNRAPSCLYLQDYTRMHGQQNIKLIMSSYVTIIEKTVKQKWVQDLL